MSPAKNVINGVRPSPLSINKGSSQVIRKQYFQNKLSRAKSGRSPVIIYMHSPKVIHTKPHDFMALVQRLTGLTRLEEIQKNNGNLGESIDLNRVKHVSDHETDDDVASPAKIGEDVKSDSNLFSPTFPDHFLIDMPLFTPGSNNLFFSPQNL